MTDPRIEKLAQTIWSYSQSDAARKLIDKYGADSERPVTIWCENEEAGSSGYMIAIGYDVMDASLENEEDPENSYQLPVHVYYDIDTACCGWDELMAEADLFHILEDMIDNLRESIPDEAEQFINEILDRPFRRYE